MADWSRAYSAYWRVRRVDPSTWECTGEVDGVTSATVSRSDSGTLESADLTVVLSPDAALEPGWVRIEAVVSQDGESEVVELSTILLTEGSGKYAHGVRSVSAVGLSVLWPASKVHFTRGQTAPKGSDGAEWAARALRGCIDAPVVADGGFTLSDHVVFTSGQTVLDGAWQVVRAAGWRLRVDGHGTVHVCPPASEPALDVTPARVADGIGVESSIADVPNVYIAIDGTECVRAENHDPASATSVERRGVEVQQVDTAPKRVGGESLEAYAARRLTEARTKAVRTVSWTRDFAPDVVPGDLVRARIPSAGIDSELRVTSQTLQCGTSLAVSESAAVMEVV